MRQNSMVKQVRYPLYGVEGVDEHAFRHLATVNDVLCYLTYNCSFRLPFVIVNYDLYTEVEK